MYVVNPLYITALENLDKKHKCRIQIGENLVLDNRSVKKIKYDLDINPGEAFKLGGVHGATVNLTLLDYGDLSNVNFESKEFKIDMKIEISELFRVGTLHSTIVSLVNSTKVSLFSSLWVPIGIFYVNKIKKNENRTITLQLIDKTKYMDNEYVSTLSFPATYKQIYDEIHVKLGIQSDTKDFLNDSEIFEVATEGYTYKQILGYIAESAAGFYIINRLGHGEIRQYATEIVKKVQKGKYKKFFPTENYTIIKKVKWVEETLGEDTGHILELDSNNIFINANVMQSIYNNIKNFTFITYKYKSINGDYAVDCGDKTSITDTKGIEYITYIMSSGWEFSGSVTQDLEAKGETVLSNTYTTKGFINSTLERIINNLIPGTLEKAIESATELITNFNGGYVIKKDGELYIADNIDLDQAVRVWRWNINRIRL